MKGFWYSVLPLDPNSFSYNHFSYVDLRFEEKKRRKENNEKKMENCDEISKLIKAFPKDIAALDKRRFVSQLLADKYKM